MNMLSLVKPAGFHFHAGDHARRMGRVQPVAGSDGLTSQSALNDGCSRASVRRREEVAETVSAGAQMAFLGGTPTAVLLGTCRQQSFREVIGKEMMSVRHADRRSRRQSHCVTAVIIVINWPGIPDL